MLVASILASACVEQPLPSCDGDAPLITMTGTGVYGDGNDGFAQVVLEAEARTGGFILENDVGGVEVAVPALDGISPEFPQGEVIATWISGGEESFLGYLRVAFGNRLLFEGGGTAGRFPEDRLVHFAGTDEESCVDDEKNVRLNGSNSFDTDDGAVVLAPRTFANVTISGRQLVAVSLEAQGVRPPRGIADGGTTQSSGFLVPSSAD